MDEGDSKSNSSARPIPTQRASSSQRILARHWQESIRYHGLPRYLRELSGAAKDAMLELLPSRRKARFGDLDYDWEHSVDTTRSNVGFGTQLLAGLTGRPYFASEPWIFAEIMQALPVDFSQFTFVDLGSGKGRALLMASDYPFQRIMGVEFMPALHRAAQKNIRSYSNERQQCRHIEAVCMDARDFQFPDGPLVVYLFNPFSEATFARVLENLSGTVEQAPRPVYIAYRFTEFENLLARANWLEKIAGTQQWAVYGNRAVIARDRRNRA